MFVMGILDIGDILLFGLKVGWHEVSGEVFCSHPTWNYITDCLALCTLYIIYLPNSDYPLTLAIWLAESSIEFVLALNRCLNFAAPKLAETLFGSSIPHKRKSKWRVLFWIVPSFSFAFYYFLYGEVNHYSPIMHSHAFTPHYGYAEDLVDQVGFHAS
jgi:hypothetical protein